MLKEWLLGHKTDERSAVRFLISGYFYLTILCCIILSLPISKVSEIGLVDTVFLSVSIVSTTGLSSVDFGSVLTPFGQGVSLLFIQLGGIGYMALSTFIILKSISNLPSISARLLRLEFQLPTKYPLVSFLYAVAIFTILIEALGAIFLYYGFTQAGDTAPIWHAIFHSVSAFCTAGFSTFDDSLGGYRDNSFITNTIIVLSLLGSIGFIVLLDFWNTISRKRKAVTLTSKIILISTLTLVLISTALIFVSDPILLQDGFAGLRNALFHAISAHTTVGFNNFDLGQYSSPAIFIMIMLMIIGSSPAGTGGGIKTTSITAAYAVVNAILHRQEKICFLNKEIPVTKVNLAVAVTFFYLFTWVIGSWLLLITDGNEIDLGAILFETSSALSTVGLSTGITADLSNIGKLIVAILMFIGRLGVLSIGFALIGKSPLSRHKIPIEDIAI